MGDVFKTCGPAELEKLTREGWTLHEIRQQDRAETSGGYTDYVTTNGYQQSVFRSHPGFAVSELVFVLRLDRDEEMAQIRDEKAQAVQAYADLNVRHLHDTKQWESALQREKDLTARYKEAVKDRTLHFDRWQASEEMKRKLESDIAKLRNEIGEGRFREILGRDK